jgi:two-component system chemotaxis response regulator CheB
MVKKKVNEAFKVIAIGASTGGPKAIEELFSGFSGPLNAGMILTQHMPSGFTSSFAERLNQMGKFPVKEAVAGDTIKPGMALLAPGGYHMVVNEGGIIHLDDGPPVEYVKPSVNVMMKSAVEVYGSNVIGVILTGMGKDGADGMAAIKEAGGRTLVQDRKTSTIYGMPRAVVERGLADMILPLSKIAQTLEGLLKEV